MKQSTREQRRVLVAHQNGRRYYFNTTGGVSQEPRAAKVFLTYADAETTRRQVLSSDNYILMTEPLPKEIKL
jgi:hypothetical protein